jgi:ParB/RepB/Spo0J family partition protein
MATGNTTLSALSSQSTQAIPTTPSEVQLLSVSEIYFDESSPRICADIDVMTDSIRERGFDTPLIVRKKGSAARNKHYEIVDGKARWICAFALGIKTVPAIIVQMSDIEARHHREKLDRAKLLFEDLGHLEYLM